MKKITVLEKLLSDGLFSDEQEAKTWVMLGRVLVGERRVSSVHEKMSPDDTLRIKEYYKRTFVGKGTVKLAHALQTFDVSCEGRVCLDCGASTGGFTDCLLQHGAKQVYAVDAGHGMLAGKLRQDSRVVNLERTNLADDVLKNLDPKPTLLSLDLSYLSLKDAFVSVRDIVAESGEVVALVKPIFETSDMLLRRSGKINDEGALVTVLTELISFFTEESVSVKNLTYSPVRGNTGVVEFFLHLVFDAKGENCIDEEKIQVAVQTSLALPAFTKESLDENG